MLIENFDTNVVLDNYILYFSNHYFCISAKNEIAEKELYLAINNDFVDAQIVENVLPYEDVLTKNKHCQWVSFSMSMGCADFFAAFVFWQKFLMQKEPTYQKRFIEFFNGVISIDYGD